jgi:tetratricopeptide (TPR) repeat protein
MRTLITKPYRAFKIFSILVTIMSLIGVSSAFAIDGFFKTQISTKTTPEAEISQANVVRLNEKIPSRATNLVYEEVLNVEIILDASKTMSEFDLQGRTKIEVARNIIATLIENLPKHTQFALRVNGGAHDNNCLDTALLIPFEKGNGSKILEKIKEVQPKGLTPLFYSIRDSIKDFENLKGGKVTFVISDGHETCDTGFTDTCAVTFDKLDQAKTGQVIHVIGINPVSQSALQGLECIAVRGHGNLLNTNLQTQGDLIRLAQKTGRLRYSIHQVFEDLTDVKLLDAAIGDSPHVLKPGIYRLEISTIPPLSTYFTIDRLHNLTLAIVNSERGLDTYDRAHLALGNSYAERGRIREAIAEYNKILKLDPRNADAFLNLAILTDDALKDKSKAIELYRTYLELGGSRQAEVRKWIRDAQAAIQAAAPKSLTPPGPGKVETIDQLKQKATEKAGTSPEEQKVLDLRTNLQNSLPQVVSFRNSDFDKASVVGVNILSTVTDADASILATEIGNRIQQELNKTPTIVIFRNNAQVTEAKFNETEKRYTAVLTTTAGQAPPGEQPPAGAQPPAEQPPAGGQPAR